MGGTEMKKKDLDKPTFIYRNGMTADKDYVRWLHEVKLRYRQSQVKAAVRVNTAMLEFYWGMGRDIVAMQAEVKWGSGFFNQLSLDMKAEFPNETGFSVTNLKYMKRWYNFYYQHVAIRQQTVDELPEEKSQRVVDFLQSIFYVTAADRLLKGEGDNPSIGLLVCRSMDKTLVEWSLADIQKPLGVASYQIQEVVDRTVAELELNNEEDEV